VDTAGRASFPSHADGVAASEEIARLEGVAFRAWPAAIVVDHKGMLMRVTGGDSRRANSAALHACDPHLSVDEAIAVAEAFYDERGLVPRFQVGPRAPAGLDEALAARGYAAATPAQVLTASLDDLHRRREQALVEVRAAVLAMPDARWVDVEITHGRYADIGDVFLRLMSSLGDRAGFGVAEVEGVAASACLAVCDEDVVVLAAMRTLPGLRRRGAARALLCASVQWARARGVSLAYLQVDRDNVAAIDLYQRFGFATRYDYHYRERPSALKADR
jgi:ribosomal protein S18 acetylase RimI-like enzyme